MLANIAQMAQRESEQHSDLRRHTSRLLKFQETQGMEGLLEAFFEARVYSDLDDTDADLDRDPKTWIPATSFLTPNGNARNHKNF
jgi:hypothetical protein